ncbi:hypothetical protein Tco_1207911 [Tanacetum coccineum]
MANKFFTDYTLCDAQTFKNIFISQLNSIEKFIVERALHKRAHDSTVNERTMQTQEKMVNMVKDKCDACLVVTKSSGTKLEKQNESSKSWNDTRAEGANICGISYIITRGRFLDLASILERETLEREYLEREKVFSMKRVND